MTTESNFLAGLIGRPIRLVAVDVDDLPPLTLREVSTLGIVAEDDRPRFYPWNEIVEISPCDDDCSARELETALSIDSEP